MKPGSRLSRATFASIVCAVAVATWTPPALAAGKPDVGMAAHHAILVYNKAASFEHASIPAASEAIRQLGPTNGFTVDVTADPAMFTRANLAKYWAIVFLHTTGNVLPETAQRSALEGYIRQGGGFLGIHAAADMGDVRNTWPFYAELVGAAFKGHTNARIYTDTPRPDSPGIIYGGPLSTAPPDSEVKSPELRSLSSEPAKVIVEDRSAEATRRWGTSITWKDEWYGFVANPRPKVHVLASLDESSYIPGPGGMNGDHPIVWCHAFRGGRSVYTGLGHQTVAWRDPVLLGHILGSIKMAMGVSPFRCEV